MQPTGSGGAVEQPIARPRAAEELLQRHRHALSCDPWKSLPDGELPRKQAAIRRFPSSAVARIWRFAVWGFLAFDSRRPRTDPDWFRGEGKNHAGEKNRVDRGGAG